MDDSLEEAIRSKDTGERRWRGADDVARATAPTETPWERVRSEKEAPTTLMRDRRNMILEEEEFFGGGGATYPSVVPPRSPGMTAKMASDSNLLNPYSRKLNEAETDSTRGSANAYASSSVRSSRSRSSAGLPSSMHDRGSYHYPNAGSAFSDDLSWNDEGYSTISTLPQRESRWGTMEGVPGPSGVGRAGSISDSLSPGSYHGATMRHRTQRRSNDRKIGHRRVDEEGNVSYKKTPSSELMAAIQLGIAQSLVNLKSAPQRDVLLQDFAVVDTVYFPSDGSQITASHQFSDFRFKTYSPVGFRHLRDMFAIQSDDFLISVCNESLKELSNPGASGSIFFLSRDDEFIIKTVQHKEAEFLQKLLPGYYMNLVQNPRTLLPKFFGLFCYQCSGKNIRLSIMNNLLPTSIPMHLKYDLKGSTFKRKASKHERAKKSPTFKDLDFLEQHPSGIELEVETYEALEKTLRRDVRVLESFKIMDYSLLLGVHNLDEYEREKKRTREERKKADVTPDSGGGDNDDPENDGDNNESQEEAESEGLGAIAKLAGASVKAMIVRQKSMNRERLSTFTTAMESITAETLNDPIDLDEDIPVGGIPARNSNGDRLLLFIGIIDILQNYRLVKKMEHVFKAVVHDGDTVSVHRPDFYAERFLDFVLKKVFRKVQSPLKSSPSKRGKMSRFGRQSVSVDVAAVGPSSETPQGVLLAGKNVSETGKSPLIKVASVSPAVRMTGVPEESPRSNGETAGLAAAPPAVGGNLPKNGVTSDSSSSGISSAGQTTLSHLSPQLRRVLSPEPGAGGGVAWSPPHSWAGSTPTHTEGTPSFTESSSSEWIGDLSHGSEAIYPPDHRKSETSVVPLPADPRSGDVGGATLNGNSFDESRTPTLTPREGGSLDLTPTAELPHPPLPSHPTSLRPAPVSRALSSDHHRAPPLHEAFFEGALSAPSPVEDEAAVIAAAPSFSEQLRAHRESLTRPSPPSLALITDIDSAMDEPSPERPAIYIPRAELFTQLHREMEAAESTSTPERNSRAQHLLARQEALAGEAFRDEDDVPEMEITYL